MHITFGLIISNVLPIHHIPLAKHWNTPLTGTHNLGSITQPFSDANVTWKYLSSFQKLMAVFLVAGVIGTAWKWKPGMLFTYDHWLYLPSVLSLELFAYGVIDSLTHHPFLSSNILTKYVYDFVAPITQQFDLQTHSLIHTWMSQC